MKKYTSRATFIGVIVTFIFAANIAHSQTNIGHAILDIESAVPGRPDVKEALNHVVELAVAAVRTSRVDQIPEERDRAIAIFRSIATTLRSNGFHHRVGTYPDSLTSVLSSSERVFDCDTGSFIFLSVADELKIPVYMVEVEVDKYSPSRAFGDHNFVRWVLKDEDVVDWDPNDERPRTGDKKTSLYGYAWSREQLIGYVMFVRGLDWEKRKQFDKALADYEFSMKLFPQSPKAKNNIAWLLATKGELQHLGRQKEALRLAQEVVAAHPTPNNNDTLACAYAINGDFESALRIEERVVQENPSERSFKKNLKNIRRGISCMD